MSCLNFIKGLEEGDGDKEEEESGRERRKGEEQVCGKGLFLLFGASHAGAPYGVWEPPAAVQVWARDATGAAGYLQPQEPRPGVRWQVLSNVGVEVLEVQRVGGTQNQRCHPGPAFVPWGVLGQG